MTPVSNDILRIWKNGLCTFSDVIVNEHPIVSGKLKKLQGHLIHLDSSSLLSWIENTFSNGS